MSDVQRAASGTADEQGRSSRLRDAVRQARIEMAERTGVVIDLRDAELARLEILNDALNPVFEDVPSGVDAFDRGLLPGDPPRLFIDMVAHVVMARDKRTYRFVQETRHGRRILQESPEVPPIVDAVTKYVARRLVERERAFRSDREERVEKPQRTLRDGARTAVAFALGAAAGAVALLAAAWFLPGG